MTTRSRFYQLSIIGLNLCYLLGCGFLLLFRGDCISLLIVRVVLLEADGGRPLRDAAAGARALVQGETISVSEPLTPSGVPSFPPPDEDGAVEIRLYGNTLEPCDSGSGFPQPDQIEIIVLSRGCEQRFLFDVDPASLIRIGGRLTGFNLPEPVRVPPCP